MARLTIKGLTEYITALEKLQGDSVKIAKRCLYEGAGVVADAMKSSIGSIPVNNTEQDSSGVARSGITSVQKQGLADSLGISRMRYTGVSVNVKIGFDGRNADGIPNASVARAAESGSSWQQPTHFVSNAINNSKSAAQAAMEAEFTEQLRQRMP